MASQEWNPPFTQVKATQELARHQRYDSPRPFVEVRSRDPLRKKELNKRPKGGGIRGSKKRMAAAALLLSVA